jgi:uncharacterized membrane protein YobD (UPF0266 family)
MYGTVRSIEMANKSAKKNNKVLEFKLTDDDYKAFGRYRVLYTAEGHKMIRRIRLTFIIFGIGVAALFTVFHVDPAFTKLVYVVCALMVVYGAVFAEKNVLKQQDRAIDASSNDLERVHPVTNVIRFDEDTFTTASGENETTFSYSDVKLVDLAETAIYVWMSDQMIMTLPLHAFADMDDMKDLYKWLKSKTGGAEAEK